MSKYKKDILFISFIKLFIIFLLPLTGDEAYFIKWANHIDIGFYDHPPMVGWLIFLMQKIDNSYIFFRLFSFVSVFVIAYFIYKILLEFQVVKKKAQAIAVLFILMPTDLFLSLFTNDIPLVLFGVIGTYFFIKSFSKNWFFFSLLAGTFFGLAFLSKYFIVFLIFGLLIYVIKEYKTKSIKNILVAFVIFMLFVSENLYFNYMSCWNNIMFNFFARTKNSHFQIKTLLEYLIILLYIFTPWGVFYLIKSKDKIFDKKLFRFILSSFLVGVLVFFLVSTKKKVGLHWLLLFTPYIYMIFVFLKDEYLKKFIKYSTLFTYLHAVVIMIVLLLPISLFQNHKKYPDIVYFTKSDKVCKELKKYDNLFTTGYTSASVLSYHCKKDIKMILNNSKYGRLDDKLLDVRDLKNKEVDIFLKSKPDKERLNKIFSKIKIESFTVDGAIFYVVRAFGFNYDLYKRYYLDIQKKRFYDIPDWLPIGRCYFFERYYK